LIADVIAAFAFKQQCRFCLKATVSTSGQAEPPTTDTRLMLVVAEMPFWPVQAITCTVIFAVLALLVRYLRQGPRKRGTSGGRDAFMLVRGLLILGLIIAVAVQGRGFDWWHAIAAVALMCSGVALHFRTRRQA
jgi:hypothetical protein